MSEEGAGFKMQVAEKLAKVQKEFKAYEVMWECNLGHKNFQTVMNDGIQHDICLRCGKHYEYKIE